MNPGKILVADQDGIYLLKLTGDVRVTLCASISDYIERIFSGQTPREIYVDLIEAEGVDSTTLGLLAKLALYCQEKLGFKAKLLCVNRSILRILESMELDELFDILVTPDSLKLETLELGQVDPSEEKMRKQVLDAHKLLVKLNPKLWYEFEDLITALDDDGADA